MIEALELLLSGGILCELAVLAFCLVKTSQPIGIQVRRFGLGFLLCFFAYILATSHIFPESASVSRLILRLIDLPNLPFLWLFLLTVFVDRFRLAGWHIAVGISYCLLMVLERLVEAEFFSTPVAFQWVYFFASIGFLVHLVWVIAKGYEGDLVSNRRRSRQFVLITILVGTVLSITLGNIGSLIGDDALRLIRLVSTFAVLFLVCGFWLTIETGVLKPDADPEQLQAQTRLTLKQTTTLEKLRKAMEDDQLFLDPDVKIGALAHQIG